MTDKALLDDDIARIDRSLRAMPASHISVLEAQLVFCGGKTTGELPDLSGKLPVSPAMPVRRRVSIEEFEADMRSARTQPEKR